MKSSHADEDMISFVKEQHIGKLILYIDDIAMKLYNENITIGPNIWTMCAYIFQYKL